MKAWTRILGGLVPWRYRDEVLDDLTEEHRGARLAWEIVRAGSAARWHGLVMGTFLPSRAVLDLRFALRSLGRAPLFTAAVLVTLGLGMGAAMAIFSVANAVFLVPFPYADANRLVHLQGAPDAFHGVSLGVHDALSETDGLNGTAAWQLRSVLRETEEGVPQRLLGAAASPSFFAVLGVEPALGRFFVDGEGVGDAVVVISHAFWRSEFGGRRDAVGSVLRLRDGSFEIIGVTPAEFEDPMATHVLGGREVDLWRPESDAFLRGRAEPDWVGFWAIGRLAPGATPAQVTDAGRRIMADLAGASKAELFQARTFREVVSGELRPTIAALLGAALLLLAIGCANVAHLLLSRATMRAPEIRLRRSLGASRWALVRQLMLESLLLATGAALLGIGLSSLAVGPMVELIGRELAAAPEVRLDVRVVAFALALGFATALVFGLAPALHGTRGGGAEVLRGGATSAGAGSRLRPVLVAAEIALGVVVLVGAALVGRTLLNLRSVEPGFDYSSTLAASVFLDPEMLSEPTAQNEAVRALEDVVRRVPGVRAVGLITDLPMSGAINSNAIPRPEPSGEGAGASVQTLVRAVTPGVFRALSIPLLSGRGFETGDDTGAPPVALVNETFARLMFGGANPLGRVVEVRGIDREIVGLVRDVVEFSPLDATGDPVLYTPYPQETQAWMRQGFALVVGASEPAARAEAVGRAIRSVGRGVGLTSVTPVRTYLDRTIALYRFRAYLLVAFGIVALILATLGVAAVTAHAVARRRKEFGIRMALGATAGDVQRLVVGQAGRITAVGLLAGVVAAFWAARVLAGLLVGVEPHDMATFIGVPLILASVAGLASWLPTRVATRLDPSSTLREAG